MKVVGIPGGMSKFEGKTRISKGVNEKKWKISRGCHDKIDWKSREVNFKKIDILNKGVQFFSGKAHFPRKSDYIKKGILKRFIIFHKLSSINFT